MKIILVFALFFPGLIFSQEAKISILAEKKIGVDTVLQVYEITIFNNTNSPICLKVSPSFKHKILSKDTIQLGALGKNSECPFFDLFISKEYQEMGINDYPGYPLVLNTRSAFVATISLVRDSRCKDSWIQYSFEKDSDYYCNEVLKKYENHQKWDLGLKFRKYKIAL